MRGHVGKSSTNVNSELLGLNLDRNPCYLSSFDAFQVRPMRAMVKIMLPVVFTIKAMVNQFGPPLAFAWTSGTWAWYP